MTLLFYSIFRQNFFKQNRPRWDAAFCGITSGAILFAYAPLNSVGKQSPCMLPFVYTSYDRARVRTVLNFGNFIVKKNVLNISYHMRHTIIKN